MPILQQENPVLRETATEIPLEEIASPRIQKIIADMKVALHSQIDGVAIAAPQIGESLRIFVVSGKVFDPAFLADEEVPQNKVWPKDFIVINPTITKRSKSKEWVEEGCLSVRWLYGQTYRHTNVTLEGYDETGKLFTRGAGGLLAQIFQHETDHLEGILFIDHAKDIVSAPPETAEKE